MGTWISLQLPSEVESGSSYIAGATEGGVSTDEAAQKPSQSPGSREAVGVGPEHISFPLRH